MSLRYLLVFILSLFIAGCDAENTKSAGVSEISEKAECGVSGVCEYTVGVVESTQTTVNKSSEIPAKREFPVDESVNPCVDFYQYACNPVIESFQLREDRSRHLFAISDSSERLLEFKKKYFASLADKKPESEMEWEIKNYYLSCVDKDAGIREEKEFIEIVKKDLGDIKTNEDFSSFISQNISDVSKLSFLNVHAALSNLDRPNFNDLSFGAGLMSLPERSYYKNEHLTKELRALIKDFFIAIGEQEPEKKAELVFNFEKALADIYPLPQEVRDRISTRTEIKRQDLIDKYPLLKLVGFLANLPKNVVIRDVVGTDTLGFINDKLKNGSLEELKSVYLYFQLSSIMDDAYPEFFAKKFEFSKKYLGGPEKRSEREERCARGVMGSFEMEVDYILLPKLFPDFPKEKFIKSIEKIRSTLIEQLKKNNWLSEDARKEAVRKIEKAKLALVTPDREEDWNFNPRATYSASSPMGNSNKLGQLLFNRALKELEGPVNTGKWEMGPLTVNAYYNPSYNKVVFPIGILQYPFYDPDEPEEVNLAAIGSVIGHELGHSIDNHGNKYDADGVFRSWVTDDDRKIFDERTKPLISQFNKIGHNGEFTLGENIGDLVGIQVAYAAAFPGGKGSIDLKRRFFLQHARRYCSVERPGVTEMRLKTDPHSLEYARTNEPTKQLREAFIEAYSCKPGDPMVISDEEIVNIW